MCATTTFLEKNMSFGEQLKRLRRDKGWTQYVLGEKADLKPSHIPKLEKDNSDPKLSTIYKLISALNCSADDLLMDYEKMEIDGILRATINRTASLPEVNQTVIADVIDKYCIAVGLKESFNEENKKFPYIRILTEADRSAVPEKKLKEVK